MANTIPNDGIDMAFPRSLAEQTVRRYAEAMSAASPEMATELFAVDAVRTDPVGGKTCHGRDEILAAFKEALPSAPTHVHFTTGPLHGTGNVFAFEFTHTQTGVEPQRTLRGIDVFTFSEDGLIRKLVAYWGDGDWREQ